MRKRIRWPAVAATALGGVLWTGEAAAQLDGFTWGHGSLNGGPRFATDDLNVGAGLNVGYTLEQGAYLGGLFNYFFGETEEFGPVEVGFDAWFLMFDAGYDFGLADQFVLRPTGAIGMVTAHGRICDERIDECESDTDSEAAFAFGANAIYITGKLTLGGEFRFFFGNEFDGIWMGFNIGTVF